MDNKIEIVDFSGKPIHVNDTNKVKKIKKERKGKGRKAA